MKTPAEVLNILEKLDASDKGIVLDYIGSLQSRLGGGDDDDDSMEHEQEKAVPTTSSSHNNNEPPFPPVYDASGPEDFEKAGDLKQEAADLASSGDWEGALDKYTAAVLAAPPSALLYANRANVLLKLERPLAAERDCDLALKENPDSAKALRTRGKARKALSKWEDALHDLSAAQQIDFDENVVQDLKELTDKRIEQEKAEAAERNEERDRLRKKAEDIKKAQEEAKKEAAAAAAQTAAGAGSARGMPGGMPFGGMPGGGMGGGGGMPPGAEGLMGALMSDPELMAAMQNPKVQKAFQELMSGPGGPMGLMSNPAKLQELMSDPEVGPVLQKLMAKLGGMGGMPGGGMGGAAATANDDIPDLDDMPDLE